MRLDEQQALRASRSQALSQGYNTILFCLQIGPWYVRRWPIMSSVRRKIWKTREVTRCSEDGRFVWKIFSMPIAAVWCGESYQSCSAHVGKNLAEAVSRCSWRWLGWCFCLS